tara:strand:+ start:380 stop:682 length:303 start_codon:yes stop_codon:yes gene_type:complete
MSTSRPAWQGFAKQSPGNWAILCEAPSGVGKRERQAEETAGGPMLDNAILRDINSKNVDACWKAESGGAFNGDHQVSPRRAYGALRPPFIYTTYRLPVSG